eukprot:5625732-Amphidinium_carterae.1
MANSVGANGLISWGLRCSTCNGSCSIATGVSSFSGMCGQPRDVGSIHNVSHTLPVDKFVHA